MGGELDRGGVGEKDHLGKIAGCAKVSVFEISDAALNI